jgi:O-antigen/teichoic acid export membrane protein
MLSGPWRRLRSKVAGSPELLTGVGYNGLAQVAPVVVVLAITPLLLSRLGLDRFGIWSLALVVLNTLRLVDGGIAASLGRFYASHAARDERVEAGRLLVGSSLALVAIGALFSLIMYPLAPTLVGLLDVPSGLHGEAVVVFRSVPALASLALLGEGTSALLAGNGRFRALAATTWSSVVIFAVAVFVFVQDGPYLGALMAVTALRFGVLTAANLWLGAPHVRIRRPLLPSRATVREVGAYSSRMQLSALTGFVNTELDAIVIAALLPVGFVGLYQIGVQVASAVRSFPLYAFPPLLTRLTTIFRLHGRAQAAAAFERWEMRWSPAVLSYGLVAVAAIGFAVPIWLGDRYGLSGVVGAILLTGYTVHVALTGMRTCYVRAIGRPGLETRCSTVWTVVNAVLTVPLALLFDVQGVVSATASAGIVASVYFVLLCRREERLPIAVPDARWWVTAAVAAALTIAGELAILATDLRGFGALALSGLPALVGWAIVAAGQRRAPYAHLLAARPG